MKRYLRIFVTVSVFLVAVKLISLFFYKGREVNYVIDGDNTQFQVYEKYVRLNDASYYYFEVDFESKKFNFRVQPIFNNDSYIIKSIYYFNDENYSCVFPIFQDDSIQTDILCYSDDKVLHPYRNLKNVSLKLDNFASSMEQYGYNTKKDEGTILSDYGIDIFEDNVVNSHTLIIPSYDGLFMINNKVSNLIDSIKLFKKDVYQQNIQGVVSNYYFTADYDDTYSFNKFKLVDLNNGKVTNLSTKYSISMNSYVQGVVQNSIYIIDRSNRKQYEIDVDSMSVNLVGNTQKGILYFNGTEFENKSIYSAINNDLLFTSYDSDEDYDYIYAVNDMFYSYKRVDDKYEVYISYIENPQIKTYAFTVDSVDRIQYIDEYVYYVSTNNVYYYHPKTGVNLVLKYSELFYNSNLKFWIYEN